MGSVTVCCQWLCDGTNAVDESHIGQQGVRKPCIVADAIWGSTGVKSIQRLYCVHDLHLHIDEKLRAFI